MRLRRLILTNFRAYKDRTEIEFTDSLTALTGRNDSGKSSILEALDIFFDGGEVTFDKTDINVFSGAPESSILCVFDDLPEEVTLDDSNKTSLQGEYLVHRDGLLWVEKRYAASGKPKVFLHAEYPTAENYADLHELAINDLKKRARDLGVDEDTISDKRVAAQWRSAIWRHSQALQLQLSEIAISSFSKDAKDLHDKIEKLFPLFALFRADRESRDNDPHAKNPLQEAVKQAQAEYKGEIEELEKKIQQRVLERAGATIDKLREMDPNLANRLNPRFKAPPKWTFDFVLDGDDDIPINKRGSGTRRLILLNFFRAEAERKVDCRNAPSVIYAIEEPETSQHPSNQQLLIEAVLGLSRRPHCQVLVTTHVPGLAGLLPIESLRLIQQTEGTSSVEPGDENSLLKIAESLGVLPEAEISGAKAILLLEGPSDLVFISHTARALRGAGQISQTLEERAIAMIWIGGCGNLKHWVTKRVADQLNLPWGMLLDSDIGTDEEGKNREHIESLCKDNPFVFLTRRREPENYLLPEVITDDESLLPQLAFSEKCDAKKIIGAAMKVRTSDVLERFWPRMSYDNIRSVERFLDEDGNERFEFTEMIEHFLRLV